MAFLGYITRELIYEGTKSEIWRATRADNHRLAIIKVPRLDSLGHQRLAELHHEHYVASRLRHEGIVEVLALEERGAVPVLVFEDFGGTSLARAFPAKVGVVSFFGIALQLCEALAFVHKRGVIHKDIKPHNIIINPTTGQTKLTDFAIASMLSSEVVAPASPERLAGTLAYMAPEQTGRIGRGIDTRADLYALGVTFFEILSGRRPFPHADPMELVHAHIARAPPNLAEVEPSVGPELAAVVARLLAKEPDERYPNAAVLGADLRYLWENLREGSVRAFVPDARRRAEFRLPQGLYGRESERARLLGAFESVAAGGRALVMISGSSGVGKSALVHEVQRPMVAHRGRLITGKFDQFNRGAAFSGLTAALRQLVDLVLASSDADVQRWRRRLIDAVGGQLGALIPTLPELELVVGRVPTPPEASAAEAQNRLRLAVLRLVGVFAGADHPLVIFLDDLQWADAATMDVLGALITDPDLAHVLVIGAYRSNEVEAVHPVRRTLQDVEASGTKIEHIELGPLAGGAVARIVGDALGEPPESVAGLAEEVHRRTEGNPLFVREFLRTIHAGGLIRFDPAAQRWLWDIAEIRAAGLPSDVTELLLDRIRRLSPNARRLLTVAACFGTSFELAGLVAIEHDAPERVALGLWESIEGDLLVPLDGQYQHLAHAAPGRVPDARLRFLHDRVRQAAYSLLAPEELPGLHLAIGRHMLVGDAMHECRDLLAAVDHINRGAELLGAPSELLWLAELNLAAGRRAKAGTAYEAAAGFFRAGVAAAVRGGPRLVHALYLGLAECEHLCGDFAAAERAFASAIEAAETTLESLAARGLRVALYVTMGRSREAIDSGVEALRLAGVEIPDDPIALRAAGEAEQRRLSERLAGAAITALVDLPRATDPMVCAVIGLMTSLMAPSQLNDQPLFEYLCLAQINLSLRHGHAEASAYGYLVYAFYLTTSGGADPRALEFARAGMAIGERLALSGQTARLHFVYGSILHYFLPLPEVLEVFERARFAGLESGDYIFLSYACSHAAIAQLGLGVPLRTALGQTDEYLTLMQRTRVASSTAALKISRRVILCLIGSTASPVSLDGADFDESVFFAAIDGGRLTFAALWFCIAKLQLALLHRDFAAAERWMEEAERRLLNSSWYLTTELAFSSALLLAHLARGADADARGGLLERLSRLRGRLQRWSESCPSNFEHRLALVDAERAAVEGDRLGALDAYERAIQSARAHGFAATDALARELAGRFLLGRGDSALGASLIADAEVLFRRWGAAPKADALVFEFGDVFRHHVVRAASRIVGAAEANESSVITVTTVDPRLDLSSAIKASQAFSAEIDVQALFRRMMVILVENAGAERGALVLLREDAIEHAADYTVDGEVQVFTARALGSDLPVGVLRHCIRSGRILVGEDIQDNPSLATDAYVARVHPLSLLAMPLLYQGRKLGAVYLENRRVWGVFNHYRLEMLRLLCTQVAIAIENARMFGELARARQTAEEASVAKSRFMLNMSHELRTPLNWIIGASEMMAEDAAEDERSEDVAELERVTKEARHLLGLIEDVLDITKLESGGIELQLSSFPFAPLVAEVVETLTGDVERAGSRLQVEIDPAIEQVTNDRPKLRQVISNVLANAARFTRAGTITLLARRAGARMRVSIADTGIGMSRRQSERIFDAFQQADDAPTRKYGGLGLGLAICRRLTELMGGQVSVVSELGVGSTFTLDLPVHVTRVAR